MSAENHAARYLFVCLDFILDNAATMHFNELFGLLYVCIPFDILVFFYVCHENARENVSMVRLSLCSSAGTLNSPHSDMVEKPKKNNISLTFCSCPACFMNCLRHKIIFFHVSMYIPAHIGQRIHLTVTQTQRICVRATHESFSCIHCMCSSSWMAMRTKSTRITRNSAHTATHARTRVNNIGIHLFYTWEYNSSTCLIYVRSLHAYRYTYGILNILFGSIYIWNSGIWFRSFSYVFSVVATSVHSLNVSVTFQTKNNNNKWQMHHRIWCLLRRPTRPVFEFNKFLFSSIRAAFDHQHCWLTHFLPHWLTPSFFAVSRIQRSHFSSRFLFNRCC